MIDFSTWFPKRWSILHRENQQQEQRIKVEKETHFKLDGRKTRWIRYWFEKRYNPKGFIYWLAKCWK